MGLVPTPTELRARARDDLRMGLPVCLQADGARILAIAVETLDADRLAALRAVGKPYVAVTARRAQTLRARAYDGDLARLELPDDADLRWLNRVADPAADLSAPMLGPFTTLRDGTDPGLARAALALAKQARLLPAVAVVDVAQAPSGITCIDGLLPPEQAAYTEVVSARLPMALARHGRVRVFRPHDGSEEHYAIEVGTPRRSEPVLARLHSACFTGDMLGSLKCDCGPQLRAALAAMSAEGAGILLYLNQEGRGIGLANKMRAYALQDQGFDTVDANHRLGFEDDERDFRIGAALLQEMRFSSVRLMTNNPAKIEMMEANGIKVVERVPLKVGETDENSAYLATKAARSGHML
ncbi:MAG: GTP cyclohydrolase II [Oceanicola sp.]|nr:GTP cyclohydrolase II [Oceanicola sp.]